jgi:hypothetical protein
MRTLQKTAICGYLRLDRAKGSNMPASDSLFCFTSNKIDSNFCPICRAPMLVRVGLDLSARTFECFNCAKVVVIPDDRSELAH